MKHSVPPKDGAYPSYIKRTPEVRIPTEREKAIREAMLPLIQQIKAYDELPLVKKHRIETLLMREDDMFMQREPICKFGTYYAGIGEYWLWYSDNKIVQSVTPDDCAKMLAEMAECYARLIDEEFKEA